MTTHSNETITTPAEPIYAWSPEYVTCTDPFAVLRAAARRQAGLPAYFQRLWMVRKAERLVGRVRERCNLTAAIESAEAAMFEQGTPETAARVSLLTDAHERLESALDAVTAQIENLDPAWREGDVHSSEHRVEYASRYMVRLVDQVLRRAMYAGAIASDEGLSADLADMIREAFPPMVGEYQAHVEAEHRKAAAMAEAEAAKAQAEADALRAQLEAAARAAEQAAEKARLARDRGTRGA